MRMSCGDAVPPRIERPTVATEFDAHSIREFDPIREAMAGHRDHDRNVRLECVCHEIAKALALGFLSAEPVDDYDIGALIDRARNTLPSVKEATYIQPASFRVCTQVLKQGQFLAGMDEPRRRRGFKAATAELDQSNSEIAVCVEVGREVAQNPVGILILLVDQGSKVALRIEHRMASNNRTRLGSPFEKMSCSSLVIFIYISRKPASPPWPLIKLTQKAGWTAAAISIYPIKYNDGESPEFAMEIRVKALGTCEVAADGGAISLGFEDVAGNPTAVQVSLNQVGALIMTLPGLLETALKARYGDQSLRYAYPLASWVVEQSTDATQRIVTLETQDGFKVRFSIPEAQQNLLGEALIQPSTARALPN